MRYSFVHLVSAGAIGLAIALAGAPASAKTVKECDAEYSANKDAIKGSGEKKKDFIAACRAGTETIPSGAAGAPAPASEATAPASTRSGGSAKTVKECDAEYAANKDAIKGAGQKKKDFVAACRAGNETIPSGAATAPAATPSAAPPAPAATTGGKTAKECDAEYKANKDAIKASGQKKKDFVAACRAGNETVPSGAAAPTPTASPAAPAPTAAPAPSAAPPTTAAPAPAPAPTATEPESAPAATAPVSASEAQAQASCPSDTVVWVNTRSGIYHFKGTHNYGTTKRGTYMCEAAAKAAGDRAAENEKHP
jgi:hypothetical protein